MLKWDIILLCFWIFVELMVLVPATCEFCPFVVVVGGRGGQSWGLGSGGFCDCDCGALSRFSDEAIV